MKKELEYFANQLKKIRKQRGLSQKDLAELVNMSAGSIGMYELAQTDPRRSVVKKLAEVLNVEESYFYEYNFFPVETTNKIISKPISHIGSGSCGFGFNNEDTVTEWFDIPASWIKGDHNDYFLCDGVGDSMIDALIANGSILLCKQQTILENGQIGAFVLNGKDYIKKFKKEGDVILLESANSKYENIIVTKNDDFRIVGKVLKVVTDIK